MKKILLITAGYIALSLGTIGIFVPLLPTTPFLLLAAACFIRSSDSLYKWLITHKLFGNYIRSYQKFGAVSIRAKVFSILLIWIFIGSSVLFIVPILWVKILLLFIALGVTIYLLRLKTLTKEMVEELEQEKI